MKYLQKLGKSLMLPVASLPAAGILIGIGYWIISYSAANPVGLFLYNAGLAIINNMSILFAIGIAVGMADDHDGTAALAGLVSWCIIQSLLSPETIAAFQSMDPQDVNPAFSSMNNQFIGIICGIIGASCYNRFKNTKLPDALSFFSGKRSVSIVAALVTCVVSLALFFIWPAVYTLLVNFGISILKFGPIGAGFYVFLNRLLIPIGLHHALNSVFWFDVAGINDLGNFWAGTGTYGQTGMYMAGFFPVMMFGLPAAALAMYHTAKPEKKAYAYGLLFSSAVSCFIVGVTEPLEFAFMFLAPGLYVIHAVLAGISAMVVAVLGPRAGFNFSAGLVDYVLSFKSPMAVTPLMLISIGLAFALIYYAVFRLAITLFNFKTPGREDDDIILPQGAGQTVNTGSAADGNDFETAAAVILDGLGGADNIAVLDNCVTRLRIEVRDGEQIDEAVIKNAGVAGIIRPSQNTIQIIIGTKVQFMADELKRQKSNLLSEKNKTVKHR